MAVLTKLVVFSSAVHQASFTTLSSLPFAIGQVQDAGLIFLSRMTSQLASKLEGEPAEVVLSTAVTLTALSTLILGLTMILIGKLKLARFVSYLPMPVVGGYLAFIGYFCLQAGLSLMTGVRFQTLLDFRHLFEWHIFLLALPGLAAGVFLAWVSARFSHYAVLPTAMVGIPVVFYVILGMSGRDMQAARDAGLVGAVSEPALFNEVFQVFDFSLVQWSSMWGAIPIWLSMVVVVAFSSSLDVAAIEIDMGKPLDVDGELVTVGLSNFFSGCTGGFTGSYIFSQTIFTSRTKCRSRLIGWIVALSELIVFMLPTDPLMYFPLFFFGATLVFIAVELMIEWLYEVRHKLLPQEYLVLLCTFIAIHALGLNAGLLFGLCVAVASFVLSYVSQTVHTMQRVYRRSRVFRPISQRHLLHVYREKILCIELKGEMFFGSAAQVLKEVEGYLQNPPLTPNKRRGSKDGQGRGISWSSFRKEPNENSSLVQLESGENDSLLAQSNSASQAGSMASEPAALLPKEDYGTGYEERQARASSLDGAAAESTPLHTTGGEPLTRKHSLLGSPVPGTGNLKDLVPSFIIFDCSKLTQIDASAARVCFAQLQRLTEIHRICIAYARLTKDMEDLLRVHGALEGERVLIFRSLHDAINSAEVALLESVNRPSSAGSSSEESFWTFSRLSKQHSFRNTALSVVGALCHTLELPEGEEDLEAIADYCHELTLHTGEAVFRPGDPGDSFYVVLEGTVALNSQGYSHTPQRGSDRRRRKNSLGGPEVTLEPGNLFGYVDLYLGQERTFTAYAATDCVLGYFSRSDIDRLCKDHLHLCLLLERAVLRHSCLELAGFGGC
ncbi:unnamed protein product [Chrysoparadoxa australica]